jgi:hypothetical protein
MSGLTEPPPPLDGEIRFDGVWRPLDQRQPLDWGQVAAEVGIADHAHLIRDFRQFTGTTPTEFLAQTPQPPGTARRSLPSPPPEHPAPAPPRRNDAAHGP